MTVVHISKERGCKMCDAGKKKISPPKGPFRRRADQPGGGETNLIFTGSDDLCDFCFQHTKT